MKKPSHPGWTVFHRRQIKAQESWEYECLACGRSFHTCGDDPRAYCNRCTIRIAFWHWWFLHTGACKRFIPNTNTGTCAVCGTHGIARR